MLVVPFSEVLKGHSAIFVDFKALFDKGFDFWGEVETVSKVNRNSDHFLDELSLCSTFPRSLSVQQLVHHNSN